MDVILLRKAISAVKNPARISTIAGCLVDSFTAQPCFPTLKVDGGRRKVDSFIFKIGIQCRYLGSLPNPKEFLLLTLIFVYHNNFIIPIITT